MTCLEEIENLEFDLQALRRQVCTYCNIGIPREGGRHYFEDRPNPDGVLCVAQILIDAEREQRGQPASEDSSR